VAQEPGPCVRDATLTEMSSSDPETSARRLVEAAPRGT